MWAVRMWIPAHTRALTFSSSAAEKRWKFRVPTAHGIVWTSHQADHGAAFILWGTRLNPAAATILEGPVLLDDAHGLALVQTACERFGLLLVA
jgi:hypothetical protein